MQNNHFCSGTGHELLLLLHHVGKWGELAAAQVHLEGSMKDYIVNHWYSCTMWPGCVLALGFWKPFIHHSGMSFILSEVFNILLCQPQREKKPLIYRQKDCG
jgi:hypothetical protein